MGSAIIKWFNIYFWSSLITGLKRTLFANESLEESILIFKLCLVIQNRSSIYMYYVESGYSTIRDHFEVGSVVHGRQSNGQTDRLLQRQRQLRLQ